MVCNKLFGGKAFGSYFVDFTTFTGIDKVREKNKRKIDVERRMNTSLITVIVPVYNVEGYLEACVESIRNQTYQNLEIILVDDGSSDRSGEICDRFAIKDSRIVVLHKVNEGQSSARNIALDRATGEYIAYVDSDDCVTKDYIEYLYSLLVKYHADMSVCEMKKVLLNAKIKRTVA